ncbi:MAG: hypothetical protein ACI8RZ_007528, partial [Myxococcota bacterium]
CHVWVLWWAQHHLGDFTSPMIFHPYGADVIELYGSDLLSPLLLSGLPIPPGLLYNLWVLGLLVAGGLGAGWLCRRAGATPGGAAAGTAVFATAPFFQHELLNGTSELIAAAILPWFTGALMATIAEPTIKRGLAVGALAGAAISMSAYNPFFLLLLLGVFLIHRAVTDPSPIFTAAMRRAVGAAAAVGMLFAGPVGWLHLTHGAGQTFSRREGWLTQDPPLPDAFADLLDWIDPRAADIPALMPMHDGLMFEYWTTCTVYLGLTALLLAGLGLARRTDSARPFPALLVISVLIACGPYLRIGGEAVTLLGAKLPLPGLTLAALFPPFIVTAMHSYRYTAVVILALAVLAGRGAKRPWWAGLIVVEALLLAPVPWPAPTTPIPDSTVLTTLRDMPAGAVLTVPMERENLGDLGRLLLAQTVHGKPVHDGGIHRRAGAEATRLFDENPLVDGLSARGGPEWPGEAETAFGLTHIYSLDYRYILMPADTDEGLVWGRERLGEPDAVDDRWVLWVLGEVGSP